MKLNRQPTKTGMVLGKARRLVIGLLVFSSLLSAEDKIQQERFPGPDWRVNESDSLNLKMGTWLRIAFVTTRYSQVAEKPLLALSSEQIALVQFSAKAEKNSELLEGMQRSGCAYARGMRPKVGAQSQLENLMISRAAPGTASRLIEKLNQRHSVRLVWNDGTERFLILAVSDCEYAALLANLREFLGARRKAVATESR